MILFFLVAGAVCAQTSGVEIISTEQAINIALGGNRNLAALELDLNGRALSAESARYKFAFNLYPVADAATRSSSDTYRYGLRGTQKIPAGTEIEAGVRAEEFNYDTADSSRSAVAHIQVNQPLFRDFGTLVNRENIEQADSSVMAARRALESRKADLIIEVVSTCQELLKLQRAIEEETQTIERYDRLYRLTHAREKQGRATRVDRLRIELLKGQSEARKAADEESLRSTQALLTDLLGADADRRFMPADEPDVRLALPARDAAVEAALSNRLDYAQALQDQSDARRGMAIARRQLQPDLALIGRYEQFGQGPDWNDAWAFDDEEWSVGIAAQSDFMMRNERIAVKQAALDEASAAVRIEDVASLVRRQVDVALSENRRADSDLQLAERNLDVARQRASLAQRLFEKGRIDHTSATDAEVELQEARSTLIDARAETVIAGYRLLRIMGLLVDSPADLKPGAKP